MRRSTDVFNAAILAVLIYLAWVVPPNSAKATDNPLSIVKTPASNLTLPQNTVTVVPGSYCNVTIWNNSTTPVYVGGPTSSISGVTVTTTRGLPICTDTAACKDSLMSVNVKTGGIALLQSAVASMSVRVMLGEGC